MKVKSRRSERHLRLWTVREFYRMGERGIFHPEERVELIEGVIYKMFRISPAHATVVQVSRDVLTAVFGQACYVRTQFPLHLGPRSEPLADVAVVAGSIRDYTEQHPTTALLLVEVSDRTLRHDRHCKGGLYAKASIADFWILNLKKRHLEVYRKPVANPDDDFGYRYEEVTILTDQDAVSPLACPASRILVADLLP